MNNFKVTFKHFLVLRFVSTFDMLFSRYVRARKYRKTLSCNFFGVHVSLVTVHSLTLLYVPDGIVTKQYPSFTSVCLLYTGALILVLISRLSLHIFLTFRLILVGHNLAAGHMLHCVDIGHRNRKCTIIISINKFY